MHCTQGWLLGYDALQAMVATAADPSVLRPKVNEDAMVGALLEGCGACTRKHWAPCQVREDDEALSLSLPFRGIKPFVLGLPS